MVIFALIQAVTAALVGWVCFRPDVPRWCAVLCGIIAVGSLLLILPAIFVLKARFREIEGGELDAARKY